MPVHHVAPSPALVAVPVSVSIRGWSHPGEEGLRRCTLLIFLAMLFLSHQQFTSPSTSWPVSVSPHALVSLGVRENYLKAWLHFGWDGSLHQ